MLIASNQNDAIDERNPYILFSAGNRLLRKNVLEDEIFFEAEEVFKFENSNVASMDFKQDKKVYILTEDGELYVLTGSEYAFLGNDVKAKKIQITSEEANNKRQTITIDWLGNHAYFSTKHPRGKYEIEKCDLGKIKHALLHFFLN